MYASLIHLNNEADYRAYFIKEYCNQTIYSHDGMLIKFRPERFEHAFFQSQSRRKKDKSVFSQLRAERIGWIKLVLSDPSLTLYAGWDTKRKRYDHTRRVCLVTPDSYVVVLRIISSEVASFVTAYVIDDHEVEKKITGSPLWKLKK